VKLKLYDNVQLQV